MNQNFTSDHTQNYSDQEKRNGRKEKIGRHDQRLLNNATQSTNAASETRAVQNRFVGLKTRVQGAGGISSANTANSTNDVNLGGA